MLSKKWSDWGKNEILFIFDDEKTEEEASEINRIKKEKYYYDKFILLFKSIRRWWPTWVKSIKKRKMEGEVIL